MDLIKDVIEDHQANSQEAQRREEAASRIQRAWQKRNRGQYLNSDTRWHDITLQARMKVPQQTLPHALELTCT